MSIPTTKPSGVHLLLHVTTGTKSTGVGGSYGSRLAVRVRARAVDGAANNEVLDALADAFRCRTANVTITRGHHHRDKTVFIEGDESALTNRLHELLSTAD